MSPVRHSTRSPAQGPDDDPDEPFVPEVDLHGKRPDEALRHLGRELHAARHRRLEQILVITGRGFGNALQQPILRGKVEQWLRGAEGQRLGVIGFELVNRGGALLVRLARSGADR